MKELKAIEIETVDGTFTIHDNETFEHEIINGHLWFVHKHDGVVTKYNSSHIVSIEYEEQKSSKNKSKSAK